MANKTVKLRAFKISNASFTQGASRLKEELFRTLQDTKTAKERCMVLSEEDNTKEQDLISNYLMNSDEQSLFCTLLRMAPGKNVQHITDNLLEQPTFNIESLGNEQLKTNSIYKRHFDFSINGDYLVTNLPGNITITHLQTYLGFFLKNERIELTPVIKTPEEVSLGDLSSATFSSEFDITPKIVSRTLIM